MAKFKVGDTVRILDWSKITNFTGGRIREDLKPIYVGRIAVIKTINNVYPDGRVGYRLEDTMYVWDERALEKLNEAIVVYRKDDKTIVALDKATGETTEAHCNPKDEFSFIVGARLAFDRILEQMDSKNIRVGDRVTVVDTGKVYTTYCEWVLDNIKDREAICKYAYGDSMGYDDGVRVVERPFQVLHVADGKAFIKDSHDRCYLIGLNGLKKNVNK